MASKSIYDQFKREPVDRVAVRVTRSTGDHFAPIKNDLGDQIERETPLPTRKAQNRQERMDQAELIGARIGHLTVLGLFDDPRLPTKTRKGPRKPWVVRCDCGRYAIRRAKTLRKMGADDQCQHCKKLDLIRRKYEFEKLGFNREDQN